MEIGLFILQQMRDPSVPAGRVVGDAIAQTVLAEELGFDTVWFAEHHFANLGMCPSPLLMAAHAAARTSRIRLGTGVVVLPFYNPMRLADEVAYVDQLSGGRLSLGIGSGSHRHEFSGLGVPIAEARARFGEALDVLDMALDHDRVEYQGRFVQVPETFLPLRPVQQPVPIFLAGLAKDPAMIERVARRRYTPFVSAMWMPAAAVAAIRAPYDAARKAAGRDPAVEPFAIQRLLYVTDDRADAEDAARRAIYTHRVVAALKAGQGRFADGYVEEVATDHDPSVEDVLSKALIGPPERLVEMLRQDVAEIGPSHLSLFMNFGGMEHARVARSMERFAREVRPHLGQWAGRRAQAAE
ncbi:alkanesulfonate monooxygenase SsuD/methylene tetrahydromethanopterin reductase-like flavin-dependent oxidoreductase (luciferase family) [Stella humosa]|uniref:Alkanesulfonate monooxygenase SsuD/methylene tetrahydromethanopterin reductase-like flavin-dependent oxidoreductase (Luciferase family) n=1 Tax=Stella humosa TaxID=94 RepID=A0A3N1M7R4_9PROT|nr:LLM class flavin-dependent oxidoreductase [Stella humosa]ROQ01872.1 alkanesulfonate monooxygenase SsuD/methylene tetrahydromethanopterin reductase-like flavin-dependent oxidoreductase (luciferase family) [Stella humosa]BBK32261.1 monooxygenase [Stella humosa]